MNKENKLITKLGTLTFGVYLIHFLVEKILLNYGLNSYILNPILGSIICTSLIMIISYIIIFLLTKKPFIRKFIT